MKEVRREVIDLKAGDVVKGYGPLTSIVGYGAYVRVCVGFGGTDMWPADAQVTVMLPPPRIGDRVVNSGSTNYRMRNSYGKIVALYDDCPPAATPKQYAWVKYDNKPHPLTACVDDLEVVPS
jgi:hypothetical protein